MSYWSEIGQIQTSSVRPCSSASRTFLRMPSLGGRSLPVRERVPSMKHSTAGERESERARVSDARASSERGKGGRTVLAVLEELLDVLLDDGAVERVVAERPADEKGAALGEHRADDGHVEVLAGDDVRQGEAEAEEEPRDGCERQGEGVSVVETSSLKGGDALR